jgi:hypothetical protein
MSTLSIKLPTERTLAQKRDLSPFSAAYSLCAILYFGLFNFGYFHQILLRLDLQRSVTMYWHRNACSCSGFCINVMASCYSLYSHTRQLKNHGGGGWLNTM